MTFKKQIRSNQVGRGGRYLRLTAMLVSLFMMGQAWAVDPMNIDALIAKGVDTHPLVGAALADEEAASEGVTAAKLGFLPTPTISAGEDPETGGLRSSIAVRQPLWTGGQLTANVNRTIYDHKAATAMVYERKNEVAKNIIDVWQSYIYAVALQDLYLTNLKDLRSFEAMMQRRVSQGASARIELDVVKNRILQDYNAHQSAIEQQKIAEARLQQMIGEKVGLSATKVPLSLLAKYAEGAAAYYGKLAFSENDYNNPTVVRQQYEIDAARQEVKAQQAGRYPKLYVQYEYIYNHKERRTKGDWTWGMSYDPGAGFSNLALERATRARVLGLVQGQEAARRTVMENIQTQYQQFISAKDQQVALIAAIKGAKLVAESYQRQFIAGRKTWLEVLNAVREHSQYQQQLLQVQAQMVASFYKLQVDFGLMPWQAETGQKLGEVEEFRPTTEFNKLVSQWRLSQAKDDNESLALELVEFPETTHIGFVPADGTQSVEEGSAGGQPQSDGITPPAINTPFDNIPPANPSFVPSEIGAPLAPTSSNVLSSRMIDKAVNHSPMMTATPNDNSSVAERAPTTPISSKIEVVDAPDSTNKPAPISYLFSEVYKEQTPPKEDKKTNAAPVSAQSAPSVTPKSDNQQADAPKPSAPKPSAQEPDKQKPDERKSGAKKSETPKPSVLLSTPPSVELPSASDVPAADEKPDVDTKDKKASVSDTPSAKTGFNKIGFNIVSAEPSASAEAGASAPLTPNATTPPNLPKPPPKLPVVIPTAAVPIAVTGEAGEGAKKQGTLRVLQ